MRKIIVLCGLLVLCVTTLGACLKKAPMGSEVSSLHVGLDDKIKNDVGLITFSAISETSTTDCTKEGINATAQDGDTSIELEKACFPYNFKLWVCNYNSIQDEYTCTDNNCWYSGTKRIEQAESNDLNVNITLRKKDCVNAPSSGPSTTDATVTDQKVNTTVTAQLEEEDNGSSGSQSSTKTLGDIANGTPAAINLATVYPSYCRSFRTSDIDVSNLPPATEYGDTCLRACAALYNSNVSTFYAVCSQTDPTGSGYITNWPLTNGKVYYCNKSNCEFKYSVQ